MRYYKIVITDPDSGKIWVPAAFKEVFKDVSITSFLKGKTLGAALNIEFDIPISTYAQPRGGAYLRVWGLSLQEIGQGSDLNFKNIEIYAGMQKGLPLAKPDQAGLIMQGTIFQGFGNWSGTEQTLDMVLLPPAGTTNKPVNISFNWQPGQPMGEAIKTSLEVAFPNYDAPDIKISKDLVGGSQQPGYYGKLSEFAAAIKTLSLQSQYKGIKPLGGGEYLGVNVVIIGKKILVYDGTEDYGAATYEKPKELFFEDMTSQPTWIGPNTLNARFVLRADLKIGDYIKFPEKLKSPYVLTSSSAALPNAPARDKSIFQGKFVVVDCHHFANFRQSDGNSWITSLNAVSVK